MDELERSLAPLPLDDAPAPIPCVPLAALLSPFITTLAISPTKTLFERVVDNVFKPLVEELIEVGGADLPSKSKKRRVAVPASEREYPRIAANAMVTIDAGDDPLEGRPATQLGQSVLLSIFREGGKGTTNEVNRRRMYTLYRGYGNE